MYTTNTACRICGSTDLRLFLDLTDQPLANSFLKSEQEFEKEKCFPLKVYFCEECNLSQLVHVVDKALLFEDYVYFSSGMPTLSGHFLEYADSVITRYLSEKDFVMEIASNDGILLEHFNAKGFRTLGIDPAKNIAEIANGRGVETLVEFFSAELAQSVINSHGKPKAILANNVVAHINDLHDLAKGVKLLLDDNGVFVFEAPYLIDMFQNLAFDTIYHEHLSYLSVRPLKTLFESHGLEIIDVEVHPVQGQSLRAFVSHKGAHSASERVNSFIKQEITLGFDSFSAYEELAKRVHKNKEELVSLLATLRSEGKRIAGYGAPAKGNTLLNFFGIGPDILEYAIDGLPSKQNTYTPGMHIPVISREGAAKNEPDYFLLLAWNYRDAILKKEQGFTDAGGRFIYPIGHPSIIEVE